MKTKSIYAILLSAFMLTACSDNFLNREPQGETLTENQYRNLEDMLEGTVRGTWSKFYAFADHDEFGVRGIDLATDIFAGDVAMASNSYGWFRTDEQGLTYAYRRTQLWYFYYSIIRSCNLTLALVNEEDIQLKSDMTYQECINAYYYAQLRAIRGWCYANLMKLFVEQDATTTANGIPYYTEEDVDALGAERLPVGDVYARIDQDLSTAILYLSNTNILNNVERESKFEFDADVARLVLAYSYLNRGGAENADLAFRYAVDAINNGKYNILPHNELFSTGFADIKSTNWLWGKDVTVDNETGLGSFFGQVDIHSYSYAWAGDTKSIDDALYGQITAKGWDDRANWFRTVGGFKLVPDRKFYSPAFANSTSVVDRDWLSDDVWMRMELAYLIAAEAALTKTTISTDSAQLFLDAIMSERVIEGKESEYQTYKASLTDVSSLTDAVIYNWRVELWGEGYSLQTLRRIEKTRTLGTNHQYRSGRALTSSSPQFTFQIPSSEYHYNPFLGDEAETSELKQK